MKGTIPAPKAIDAQKLGGKTASAYEPAIDVLPLSKGGTGCTSVIQIQRALGIFTSPKELGVTSKRILDVWAQLPNPGIYIGDASDFYADASNKLPLQYATLLLFRRHATRMAALLFASGGAGADKLTVNGKVYTVVTVDNAITDWIPLHPV